MSEEFAGRVTMKTYRNRLRDRRPQRGRGVESVMNTINSTPIEPVIVNPESKFVVVTYWWGQNNINANLQRPCPEDIIDTVRTKITGEEAAKTPEMARIFERVNKLNQERQERELEDEEWEEYLGGRKKLNAFRTQLFARDDIKARVVTLRQEEIARLTAAGQFKPGRSYAEMIRHWEETMRAANCNYLAANTEFPGGRDDYQHAINGKPVFIKRVLDVLKDKKIGVLYIDGDMDIHTYPHIFDIQNVDFMARGWNMDPRDGTAYWKSGGYFNPYIFETSGGTMYFGNTKASRNILDRWIALSADPVHAGKADDRLLSMAYTIERMVVGTNIISLPIEYLWLTDKYSSRFNDTSEVARKEWSIIEHPACLTGEERATEGLTVTNRQPDGYEAIEEAVDTIPRVETGILYETIYFSTPQMAEGMRPWLKYLTSAVQKFGSSKGFKVVPYDQRYGEYNAVADENTAQAKTVQVNSTTPIAPLEKGTPIHVVLAYLMKGVSVNLGRMPERVIAELSPDIDFAGFNNGTLGGEKDFQPKLNIETRAPMFLKAGNSVLVDLIRMCRTIDDMNTHLRDSYMFLSRIRWKVVPSVAYRQINRLFLEPINA